MIHFGAKTPQYLYHLTTEGNWRQIQTDGALTPRKDVIDSRLRGVFTLEQDNFLRNWTIEDLKAPEDLNADRFELKHSPADHLFYKLRKMAPKQNLVLLRIRTDPEEPLLTRDLRYLLSRNRRTFQKHTRPIADVTQRELNDGALEYVLTEPVPLERIRDVSRIGPQALPLARLDAARGEEWILERWDRDGVDGGDVGRRMFFDPDLQATEYRPTGWLGRLHQWLRKF